MSVADDCDHLTTAKPSESTPAAGFVEGLTIVTIWVLTDEIFKVQVANMGVSIYETSLPVCLLFCHALHWQYFTELHRKQLIVGATTSLRVQ